MSYITKSTQPIYTEIRSYDLDQSDSRIELSTVGIKLMYSQ